MSAPLLIDTPRLQLLATHPGLVDQVATFYARNATHFAPWDPPLPADHLKPERIAQSLADGRDAFEAGQAHRWWLQRHDAAAQVLGSVHLSNIVRGAFQCCNLGYALDQGQQGQGLMREALVAVIAHAFAPAIALHRIQAAVRPENVRSVAVLRGLGFRDEGLARDYLYIDGAWRDHRIFALTHNEFVRPESWPRKDIS